MKKLLTKTCLLAAVALLALTGCAAMTYRHNANQLSTPNAGSWYNGYCWDNNCAPYIFGPVYGFGYGWIPDEDGGDGFIGGDDSPEEDEGPGR